MNSGVIAGIAKPIPRLIQGTLFLDHADVSTAFALFDAAFDAGCAAFDTASVYGAGSAERLLGSWLRSRGVAHSVVVIDKGCHPRESKPRMTPVHLENDLRVALDRLQLERLDLFLLHRDDPSIPPDEIVSALNDARAKGQISAFGASNWTHTRLQLANEYAARNGLVSFAASSPGFSLAEAAHSWPGCVHLHRTRDAEAWRWYDEQKLPILAWSPLASGFLTGRFSQKLAEPPKLGADRAAVDFYGTEANFARLERLGELARRRGVSLPQAAIAYVLNARSSLSAVIGCRDRTEFLACLPALTLELSPAELDWLDSGASSRRP
jgi:aryl-alcohol dehydrogenase-like predicted oxidoreductase